MAGNATRDATRNATRNATYLPGEKFLAFKNDYSLNFDGTDDVATTTYTPSTIHSTGMTMSYWCKMDNFSGFQIMGNWDDKGIFAGFDNSGRPDAYFGVQNVQKATTDISSYVSVGTWHHICVTASGASGVGTYYVDGVARDTSSYTADATKASITPIAIGALQQSTGLAYYMEGDIDEVAVWDKGLSASDVAGIYNGGIPTDLTKNGGGYVSSSDLQSWWRNGDATIPADDGTNGFIFDQADPGLGAEQVTNGDFSSSSNWTLTGSAEITGGVANWPDATNSTIYQNASLQLAGVKVYRLEYDIVTTNGSSGLRLDGGSSAFATVSIPSDTVGKKTVYVVTNGSQAYIMFNNSAAFVGSIDNVSLKPVNGSTATINGPTIQAETP